MAMLSSSVLNDGSLMVDILPAVAGALPNCRSPGEALVVLEQGVGEQIGIVGQSAAVEVSRLPRVGLRID